jgi:hypothetical protein
VLDALVNALSILSHLLPPNKLQKAGLFLSPPYTWGIRGREVRMSQKAHGQKVWCWHLILHQGRGSHTPTMLLHSSLLVSSILHWVQCSAQPVTSIQHIPPTTSPYCYFSFPSMQILVPSFICVPTLSTASLFLCSVSTSIRWSLWMRTSDVPASGLGLWLSGRELD